MKTTATRTVIGLGAIYLIGVGLSLAFSRISYQQAFWQSLAPSPRMVDSVPPTPETRTGRANQFSYSPHHNNSHAYQAQQRYEQGNTQWLSPSVPAEHFVRNNEYQRNIQVNHTIRQEEITPPLWDEPSDARQPQPLDEFDQYPLLAPSLEELPSPHSGEVNSNPLSGSLVESIQNKKLLGGTEHVQWTLDKVLMMALHESLIAETAQLKSLEGRQLAGEAYGEFDWQAFLSSSFTDDGSARHKTGARDELEYGFNKRFGTGGQLQLAHAVPLGPSAVNQNGDVFSLNFEQPVLKNAGKHVVMSNVLLARLEANRVSAQSVIDLSRLLVDVTNAYWTLFQARGEYLVRQQQLEFADQLIVVLKARRNLDAEENSIALAEANQVEQMIEMQKAETAMLEQQNTLLQLLNLNSSVGMEIIPVEPFSVDLPYFDDNSAIETGRRLRAELHQAAFQVQTSGLERLVAENSTLPQADLFVESTFAGASIGTPQESSYSTGFNITYPLANRTARYEKRRRELELARAHAELRDIVNTVELQIKNAINQLRLTNRQIHLEVDRWRHATRELDALTARLNVPKKNSNLSFQINQIFDAQNRQGDASLQVIRRIGDFHIAMTQLEDAKGTLVTQESLHNLGPLGRGSFVQTVQSQWDESHDHADSATRVGQEIRAESPFITEKESDKESSFGW